MCAAVVVPLLTCTALRALQWDRGAAEAALTEARNLRDQIKQTPNPAENQYLRCVRTYRQVYYRDPHYGGCDDALFESAQLYAEMGERFRIDRYYTESVRLIRFMLESYPLTKHTPDALLFMGDLLSGRLEDEQGAEEAYSELRLHHRTSNAAAALRSRASGPAPQQVVHTASTGAVPRSVPSLPVRTTSPPSQLQPTVQGPSAAEANNFTPVTILSIRHWSTSDYTRVILDLDNQAKYTKTRLSNPDRIYFDISNSKLSHDLLNKTFVVGDTLLKQIRAAQNRAETVRVVLDFAAIRDYSVFELYDPFRIVVDIHGTSPGHRDTADHAGATEKTPAKIASAPQPVSSPVAPEEGRKPELTTRGKAKETMSVPLPMNPAVTNEQALKLSEVKVAIPPARTNPSSSATKTAGAAPPIQAHSIEAEKPAKSTTSSALGPAVIPKASAPTSRGNRTLTRMLGLKIGRIVLDPGHGGHDTGTIGRGGLAEKDLVLQVAKELRALLEEKLGAEVVLTRETDRFISLEERTAIANEHNADLFLSIHANSSSNRSTSGVETYYLNFARSDAEREVAARENATTVRNVSDLQDLIRKIAQAEKSSESREFAAIVQRNLFGGARQLFPSARNRGVRTAPFVVLIGANMPSALAEVAFISNPRDEKLLKQDDNRQRIVKALFTGIEGYMKTLGSEVAQSHAGSH